ncbi:mastermind-like protein 3 isoform X2 [Melanotaenia boesemani]|uniref:mastermind-like protein 3 isoform X2 n=1 Tax=Melanotaenia boesemani TaxID=1250792 RepID=UPI001C0455A1|nr:mastermind-like protein 3 isoform X2 [Melanotaenia boesemani]
MGDFASPAAGPNGSICINNNMNPASGSVVPAGAVGIPKHSTVVERLRQRIEGCRRHHVNCENRYQQAHAELLEIERRETVSLYQRSLEQRAKKSAGGSSKQPQSKQPDADPASSTEQRNNTLIALQETVKRKLDSARSPLNGDQNGIGDGGSYSPTTKRVRKEGSGGLDSLTGLPNNNSSNVPPISPLHHQMDIKPLLSGPNTSTGNNTTNSNGTHSGRASDELGKNGGSHVPDMKLNGSLDLEDSFGLLKELKQEPLDDGGGMESSDSQSLSNQNKLFSDINLNDQEWQELIDELANTVPEDDMHDLFNEDFEDKKEADFGRPANNQTPGPQEAAGNTTATGAGAPSTALPPPPQPPQGVPQVPIGSPQVRPSSSGPQFATTANGTPPQQPLQQSPAVAMASGSPLHNCVARSPQTPTQAQTQSVPRPGNGYMMNPGPGVSQAGTGPAAAGVTSGGQPVGPVTPELSPAEQLKAMAQQHAKLLQQKQQQAANWSPAGAPTSPYNSGPFNPDKPNSPMMYPPQAFNTPQGPLVAGMTPNNGPKAPMNNYLPHNHMGMMGQQQPNSINQNTLSKQQQQQQTAAMLSYNNTKPLTHFSGSGVDHMGQRMTPPMGGNNQVKNPMMPPYMGGAGGGGQGAGPGQTQGPIPGQTAHLSEEQKRMMMMKQKALNQNMPYSTMQPHGQEQGMVGMSRPPGAIPPPHPAGGVSSGVGPNQGSGPPPGYVGNQQQAALMKQMMAMEQEKRVQMQMMEQQKQQLFREQRQQQQQQLLAKQQQQQQQHLPRQMGQGQRNPYPQVTQYQGPPQDIPSRSQPLQSIRATRLLQQQQHSQQQMVQMSSVQGQGGSVGPQPDMGLPYGTQGSNQSSLYGLNPSMSQMIHQQQHQSQSVQASMGLPPQHNPAGGPPRQAGAGPGVGGMPGGPGGGGAGGYGGQGMLMNSMTQQTLKGPPNAKVQAQRLQNMLGAGGGGGGMAAGGWPQQQGQSLQAMGGGVGRTTGGGGGDMVGFSSAQGYGMQPGQPPRMAKQHFPGPGQAMSQGMDPRVGNPAAGMGGPMMGPHMGGQPRTNQPRPMVMNQGMNQGVMGQGMSGMGGFGPGPGGPGIGAGGGGGGPYGPGVGGQSQGYQRTANQDMSSYGYGGGPSGGGAFGLGDGSGPELDSSDGWMEEFFPSQ